MKNITRKFIHCGALMVVCFLASAAPAQGSRGHHQSGIIGRVQVEQIGAQLPWQVRVTTDDFSPVAVLPADEGGQFLANLKPGTYHLNAFVGGNGSATLAGPTIQVTVTKKDFTVVELPLVSGPS